MINTVAELLYSGKFIQAARLVTEHDISPDDVKNALSEVIPEHALRYYMQDLAKGMELCSTQ